MSIDSVKREFVAQLAKELNCEPHEVSELLTFLAQVFEPAVRQLFVGAAVQHVAPLTSRLEAIGSSLERIATVLEVGLGGDPDSDHAFRHPSLKRIADRLEQG